MLKSGMNKSWFSLGALAAGVLEWSCTSPVPGPRPDIVLISLDTTRADHVGAYGSSVKTPAMDRLAAEGVVFENVSAACTTTLPSHVSLFTGRWPLQHGVVRNGFTVHPDNRMLPEVLRELGYRTAGVSAAVALSRILGFPQGFEVWDQDPETGAGPGEANRDARRAEAITDAALSFLAASSQDPRPLFLFVHYVDPHAPYDPPEPYRSMYGEVSEGVDGSYASIERAQRLHRGNVPGAPPVAAQALSKTLIQGLRGEPLGADRDLARLYAGEVSYMDGQLQRLFDGLAASGLYRDALVIVTADHGETFWEHPDVWSHGIAAYETTVRIPLIIRFPRAEHAGLRVGTLVSNVDVAPTLFEYLGLRRGSDLDGASLLPLVAGGAFEREASFSQGPLPAGPVEAKAERWKNAAKAHSIRRGRWKLVRTPYLDYEELYDLERDPGEQDNLLASTSPEAQRALRGLREALAAWMASADPLPSQFFPRMRSRSPGEARRQREMWEHLKVLGYVSEGAEPPDP